MCNIYTSTEYSSTEFEYRNPLTWNTGTVIRVHQFFVVAMLPLMQHSIAPIWRLGYGELFSVP